MLEKFGQAIPVGGDKPSGWPKYLAVTYPTSYSPMEIHALRKTIYGAWLRTYLESIIETDPNNPVDQHLGKRFNIETQRGTLENKEIDEEG